MKKALFLTLLAVGLISTALLTPRTRARRAARASEAEPTAAACDCLRIPGLFSSLLSLPGLSALPRF